MPELETVTPSTGSALTAREKRDLQKSQLRPLANRRPELYEEDEYSSEEYEQMMDMYNGTLASIEEGEIVKSRVLEISDKMVVLDIGFKSEGSVPLEEFKDLPDIKPGDEVEVLLEHLEDQEGAVVLSKKKADSCACGSLSALPTRTTSRSKARSSRRLGRCRRRPYGCRRVPPRLADRAASRAEHDELLGQKYEFKIIKLNKRRRNIVVSRRDPRDRARRQAREADEGASEGPGPKGRGQEYHRLRCLIDLGVPTACFDHGHVVFLSLTRRRWSRSAPSSRSRSWISTARAHPARPQAAQAYPWKDVAAKYPVGTRVTGKVAPITNYGAFIQPSRASKASHISDELDAQRSSPVVVREHRRDDRSGRSR
jgi:small subunit ribosomal protein S1